MKILQINPIAGHSSTGRAVSELDHYFIEQGHESYVACIEGYNVTNKYCIGSSGDRKIHALLSRVTGYEACFSQFATKKLIEYIKSVSPDVVRIGILHSNYLNYKMLFHYLAQADIPTVLVLNDCWHYTGKCVHYTENKCWKWKTGCGHCPHLENGLPTWFFDRTAKLLKMKQEATERIPRLAVVGVSDWITNEARSSVLQSAKIIKRIYNWIDLDQFYPREDGWGFRKKYGLEKRFVILGVASGWSHGKGLEDFIKLSEVLPETDYRILLVGRIPDSIPLPDSIMHIPETHDVSELAGLYSMADVFVTCSREESFGKVSAESLACGTPVICYNSTASPELVGEHCGETVSVGYFDGIIQALKKIKNLGKEAYSQYCVQYARENFSLQKSAGEYLELFEQLRKM